MFYLPNNRELGRFSALVRHAEREPILTMHRAAQPDLTEKGRADAFRLGETISIHSPLSLFFSPVNRCRDTASNIARGIMGKNGIVLSQIPSSDLAGPYLQGSWKEIASLADAIGQEKFLRKWFNGEISEDLLLPLPLTAAQQVKILTDQLDREETSCVNITHDWNIMSVLEHYLHLKHEKIGSPDYLEGITAFRNEGKIHLTYRNYSVLFDRI